MLKDIQKTEEEAQQMINETREKADEILRAAREEASQTRARAEEEARALRASGVAEGGETGQREAEKVLKEAQAQVQSQEQSFDSKVVQAADTIVQKILNK